MGTRIFSNHTKTDVVVVVHYLSEVANLRAQLVLHSVDGGDKLTELPVDEAGIVFVLGQLQNNSSYTG